MTTTGRHSAKVAEFKGFVKSHPKLVREVREGRKTWQQLYEEWYLLGSDDESWEPFRGTLSESNKDNNNKKNDSKNDLINQLMSSMKNVDMNQMQQHISSVSGAIGNIQQLIEQFQTFKKPNQVNNQPQGRPPFPFFKD